MARSIPKWFERWAEGAVEQWEHNGRWYIVRQVGERFTLDYLDLDGMGGGGTPWMTREDLEAYLKWRGIERPVQQLTLGI